MCFVYILKTERGYYVGSAANPEERLKQHISGKTHSTKRMGKLELVFLQKFSSTLEARRIERKIKKLKRKDYIEKIINDGYIKLGTPR